MKSSGGPGRFKPSGKYWHYFAGKPWVNRVVAQENRYGTIRIVWTEDKKVRAKHVGSHDRFKAVIAAENKAAELLEKRKAKRTYRPTKEIIEIRADLIRVARLLGRPEGVAPRAWAYREHGVYGITRVQSAFSGWRFSASGKTKHPKDTWVQAMKRYGLKPAGHWRTFELRDVLMDLRRVALKIGKPFEMPGAVTYDRHGKWRATTVRDRFKGMTWPEIGDQAGLETPKHRRDMAEKMARDRRPPTLEQQQSTREAA